MVHSLTIQKRNQAAGVQCTKSSRVSAEVQHCLFLNRRGRFKNLFAVRPTIQVMSLTMQINSLRSLIVLLCSLSLGTSLRAQSGVQATLPDAPDIVATLAQNNGTQSSASQDSKSDPKSSAPADPTVVQEGQQTKRILFIIPNFRAVSVNTHLPPQTVKDKFIVASQDSFDYSAIIFAGALAGVSMATNQTSEFGHGAAGYGRYYWHTFVDQTVENYMVEFVVPAIRHEDTRYYTLGSNGGTNSWMKRTGYALSRAVVTRSDSGNPTINTGEIIGAGAAAGISNLYYPSKERTFGNTAQRWGVNVGIDAGTFVFKEFWPDINRTIFHAKQ